jgi:hypothetical protein
MIAMAFGSAGLPKEGQLEFFGFQLDTIVEVQDQIATSMREMCWPGFDNAPFL